MASKLTDVYCTYTGGGIYICTAKYGDVWLMSDIMSYGTYDVPYDDIEEKYDCDYDAHWKDSAEPLPMWRELLDAIRESHEAGISDNVDMNEVASQFREYHRNLSARIGDDDRDDPEDDGRDEKRDTVIAVLEAFEDFLDEKGIVIPNTDKQDAVRDGADPDSICNIYGTDWGNLYDTVERIIYN